MIQEDEAAGQEALTRAALADGMGRRALVTGGSGFIGRVLSARLAAAGYQVRVVTRAARGRQPVAPGVSFVEGNPTEPGGWQRWAADSHVIINLVGQSIFNRWTRETKKRILESRVLSTRNLVAALTPDGPTEVLLNASAVGYYGFHEDEALDEQSPPGADFLARVCTAWEDEAARAAAVGVRVIRMRFGIVLEKGGGALGQMVPLFRFGLGGRLGDGKQWFSWIHRQDLVRAALHLIGLPGAEGVFNFTAPYPVTNLELTHTLARKLRRPAFIPVPALAMRLVLGEFGSVLLKGQRVMPKRLQEAGFAFDYPTLDIALDNVLAS